MLKQAIDSTGGSIEASKDLGQRATEVLAKDAAEKKEREAMATPAELKAKAEEAKKDATDPKRRKPPTLYKPGEKPAEDNKQK